MAEQIKGAKKLINDRGGCNYLHNVLGWPYSTLHTFLRSDQMPDYRWRTIEALPLRDRPTKPPKADGHSEAA